LHGESFFLKGENEGNRFSSVLGVRWGFVCAAGVSAMDATLFGLKLLRDAIRGVNG